MNNSSNPNNFPKISSNFEKFAPHPQKTKQPTKYSLPMGKSRQNTQLTPASNLEPNPNSNEITHAPVPYIVVQTLAAKLRTDQAKHEVSIELNGPKFTTMQDMPAAILDKDDFMVKLATSCKYTLIGKFTNTMPKLELIRKSFIL